MPQMPDVSVEFDVPMQTRDGVTLRANIYRPGGEGKWPVLLTRLPYGKDLPIGSSVLDPVQAARRGYVVVVQDTRGTGASEGEWYPFVHEAQDGVDTVSWAAALPYADGQVGTFGASYFGFTQWAAAVEKPPALKAMVPLNTWRDPLNGSGARGGAPDLGAAAGWYLSMGLGELLRRYASDQEALGAAVFAWAQEQDRLGPFGYWSLPMRDFAPLRRLSVGAAFFETMTTLMDRNDRTTAAANIAARQAGVMVPSLNIGGWYDIFLGDTIANYQFMRSQGAPAKLLLGPWTHITSNNPVGERSFGTASQTSFLYLQTDQHALQLRWFDHWLKGIDTGMLQEPPVRIFVMGTNVWRDEADWPLARARMTRFHLHEGGRLSPLAPGDEAPDVYMYDPEDPTPTLGGSTLMTPDYPAGPYDQRPIEERPDVLVYTSDVLGEDLEVTGPLTVYLWAVSSAPDTDFVARLTDVLPDGCSYNLADGIVRARYRNFGRGEAPSPIEPGRPYLYEIDLWATSNVFLAGHRIRLHITSSSFPRWGRNQNTGHELSADSQMEAAWQTILHDAEHPSCVMLPLVAA